MAIHSWLPSLASLLAAYACVSQNPNTVLHHQDPATELQALLEEAVTEGIPGISAAIATRNGIVWRGVTGKADLQTGAPVRPDLLFGIGSITKTFIAVVILQLFEEGQLDLKATAASLLGAAVEGIPNTDKATIAQYLNHTSGLPSWEDDPAWIREGRGDLLDVSRIWDKTSTLPYITGHAPLANPGEKFSYANTNFTLLGMIIEEVTGNDVVDEIRRRILIPNGLKNIYLEGFEPVPGSQLPHRYHWATPAFRQNAGVNEAFPEVRPELIDVSSSNLSVEWTAGGMVATAQDLALYTVALRDGRLLRSQSMEFMTEWFPVEEGVQVGHNLYHIEYPDSLSIIGHNGDVLGFTGSMYWIEGVDAAVSVLCNVGAMHSGAVPGKAPSVAQSREFIELVMRVVASI